MTTSAYASPSDTAHRTDEPERETAAESGLDHAAGDLEGAEDHPHRRIGIAGQRAGRRQRTRDRRRRHPGEDDSADRRGPRNETDDRADEDGEQPPGSGGDAVRCGDSRTPRADATTIAARARRPNGSRVRPAALDERVHNHDALTASAHDDGIEIHGADREARRGDRRIPSRTAAAQSASISAGESPESRQERRDAQLLQRLTNLIGRDRREEKRRVLEHFMTPAVANHQDRTEHRIDSRRRASAPAAPSPSRQRSPRPR